VGEEGFTDLNGNGMADNPTEMKDANGASTDMGEAYVDYNENGVRDAAAEPFIDFGGSTDGSPDGIYNGPDGKYNGVLCDSNAPPDSAVACSTQKNIHVRGSTVIVLSSSTANITINGGAAIALPPCVNGVLGAPRTFTVTVVDLHSNAMPAGTIVAFSSTNGTVTSDASYTVPNTAGCRAGYGGCPASSGWVTFGDIPVTMRSDATVGSVGGVLVCDDTNASGTFTVKVTTPNGVVTTGSVNVTD
jgi:hypothetical protein